MYSPYLRDASREEIVLRNKASIREVHQHWNDLMVILDGAATLQYGGTITDAKQTALGELRGGSIKDGKTVALGKDAMVIIPAGLPHQMRLAPGGHVKYVVFGTRE